MPGSVSEPAVTEGSGPHGASSGIGGSGKSLLSGPELVALMERIPQGSKVARWVLLNNTGR
ncbi:hypothetical protein [Mycobacteroides chelonae]|uniref:hypothetical protein n=1 Tax=Mycobacteroides chelonae TaxID=1774 RepID=UPI001041DB7C|nr:hypothetical protein [Mycobacteroides chelonae]